MTMNLLHQVIFVIVAPRLISAMQFGGYDQGSNSRYKQHDFTDGKFNHYRFPPPLPSTTTTTTVRPYYPPPPPPPPPCIPPHNDIALKLTNVGLKKVIPEFVNGQDVSAVYLDKNEIEKVSPTAFRLIPNLKHLDLSENRIPTNKLLWIGEYENLRVLKLDNNKPEINKTFEHRLPSKYLHPLPSLMELSLKSNEIIDVDIAFKEFAPRLSHLDLSDNNITSTAFLDNVPSKLSQLSLQKNLIKQIKLSTSENIVMLNVSGNRIQQLCNDECTDSSLSLDGFYELQQLDVSRNKISEITVKAFTHAQKLRVLNLSNNKLKHIEEGTFNSLNTLETLILGKNHLISVPNLCHLRKLTTLDLSHNNIVDVNSGTLCQSKLQRLLLNNNKITGIQSKTFESLTSLEDLDLSCNLLFKLPSNWIHPANNLRVLSLKNNTILKIEDVDISGMSALRELHLESNPMTYFDIAAINHYPSGLRVCVKGEPEDDEDTDDENEIGTDDDDDENLPSGGLISSEFDAYR